MEHRSKEGRVEEERREEGKDGILLLAISTVTRKCIYLGLLVYRTMETQCLPDKPHSLWYHVTLGKT